MQTDEKARKTEVFEGTCDAEERPGQLNVLLFDALCGFYGKLEVHRRAEFFRRLQLPEASVDQDVVDNLESAGKEKWQAEK